MAIRIELNKKYLVRAIDKEIASLIRNKGKSLNADFDAIVDQDVKIYRDALAGITETK